MGPQVVYPKTLGIVAGVSFGVTCLARNPSPRLGVWCSDWPSPEQVGSQLLQKQDKEGGRRGPREKGGDHKADDSLGGNEGPREYLFCASLRCSGAGAGMPVPKPLLGSPVCPGGPGLGACLCSIVACPALRSEEVQGGVLWLWPWGPHQVASALT